MYMKAWMVKRTEKRRGEERRGKEMGEIEKKRERKSKEKISSHIKNNISIAPVKITKRFHIIFLNMKSFIK